jgi:hypothetical protein
VYEVFALFYIQLGKISQVGEHQAYLSHISSPFILLSPQIGSHEFELQANPSLGTHVASHPIDPVSPWSHPSVPSIFPFPHIKQHSSLHPFYPFLFIVASIDPAPSQH